MPHKKKKAFLRNAKRSANDFYENPPALTKKGKGKTAADDTPKSFLHLINRKPRKELIAEGKIETKKETTIKIQPGESLHDFHQRVNQEIPVRMGAMNREPLRKERKPKASGLDEEEGEQKKIRRRRNDKRKRSVSPDPYAHLAKPVPFNQPVQAPPSLPAPSRAAKSSLPNTLSAARKDVLEAVRQDVITKYRQRMGRM